MNSNESTIRKYILSECKKKRKTVITLLWIVWMLDLLEHANKKGLKINPEWLSANVFISWNTIYGTTEDNEPSMFLNENP